MGVSIKLTIHPIFCKVKSNLRTNKMFYVCKWKIIDIVD